MGELLSFCRWVVELIGVCSCFKIKFQLFTHNVLTGTEETTENKDSWGRSAKGPANSSPCSDQCHEL